MFWNSTPRNRSAAIIRCNRLPTVTPSRRGGLAFAQLRWMLWPRSIHKLIFPQCEIHTISTTTAKFQVVFKTKPRRELIENLRKLTNIFTKLSTTLLSERFVDGRFLAVWFATCLAWVECYSKEHTKKLLKSLQENICLTNPNGSSL